MRKHLRLVMVAAVFAASAFALAPSASAVCWHTHPDGTIEFHLNDADCYPPPPGNPPAGHGCRQASATDPGTEGGDVQTGIVSGGPLVVMDPQSNSPRGGTMRCNTQAGGGRHSDPDNGASASASGNGVVLLPPTLISYVAPQDVPMYLCTSFTFDGGGTLYWADSNDPTVPGHWTTDPNASCGLMTTAGTSDLDPFIEPVDPLLCPILAALGTSSAPGVWEVDSEGDVTVAGEPFWDCPPYGA